MFRLDGKVALVTGGSRGIGRACCEALAEQGATVVVNYVKGEAAAREVAEAIAAKGGKAEVVGLRRRRHARRSTRRSTTSSSATASIDILVANAGISIDGLLLRLKDEDLDKLFATNVRGAIACARACSQGDDAGALGPHRLHVERRRRDGQRRADGLRGDEGGPARRGQVDRARVRVAQHHRQRRRPRLHRHRHDVDDDPRDEGAAASKIIPLGRTGSARDIAAACVYLASDEAGYVTGQVLRVNGGMYV